MPHIANFHPAGPEIGIKLVASNSTLYFTRDRVDVTIRFRRLS